MTDLKPEDLGEASALLMDLAQRFMRGEIIGQTPYAAKCAVAMEMVTTDLADRARMEKALRRLCDVVGNPSGIVAEDVRPSWDEAMQALGVSQC